MSKTVEEILQGVANEYSGNLYYTSSKPLLVTEAERTINQLLIEKLLEISLTKKTYALHSGTDSYHPKEYVEAVPIQEILDVIDAFQSTLKKDK